MKLIFLLLVFMSGINLFAQTTNTTLNLTCMYTSGLDFLDPIFTHRYKLYVNKKHFHTFEKLDNGNTLSIMIPGNGYPKYETTLIYKGDIPCDNTNKIGLNATIESDTDGDQVFDWETPMSETLYLDIQCLSIPQNFKLIF